MNSTIKRKLDKISSTVEIPKPDPIIKMYKIHKYWARKPWYLVSAYIKSFTKKGDLVYDPFAGSGVTGVESLVLERNSVLVDLNPISDFISRMTIVNHNITESLESEFYNLSVRLEDEINKLYYVSEKCPICKENYIGEYFTRGPKFDNISAKIFCPKCGKKKTQHIVKLTKEDLIKLEKLENRDIPYWYPKNKFPKKFDKDRVTYKGITSVDKLFTKRNLFALSLLREAILEIKDETIKNLFMLSFSDTILHASKLKGVNVRPLSVNNYWVPDDWIEENVWFRFSQRVGNLLEGKAIANKRIKKSNNSCQIYNQSSTEVKNILNEDTVDFIFTDPPYGDSIQYDELSMVWNFWFESQYLHSKEIIINRSKKKDLKDYGNLLSRVFTEAYRVLKPEKYMIITFQNKDLNIHEPLGNSFNKNWAKRSPKTDMYLLFKKTGQSSSNQLSLNFNFEEIDVIINRYKSENNELNITKIYDEVLEKAIEYVYKTEKYDDLKNINIYLIDKLIGINDK